MSLYDAACIALRILEEEATSAVFDPTHLAELYRSVGIPIDDGQDADEADLFALNEAIGGAGPPAVASAPATEADLYALAAEVGQVVPKPSPAADN